MADKKVHGSADIWLDPGEEGANLEIEDFVSYRIVNLAFLIQRNLMRPYVVESGLSIPEWRLLAMLSRQSPMPFSGLGARSLMDKSLVSRALRQMVDKGLVSIDPDPQHKRKLLVSVAPAGRALYRRILPKARRAQTTLIEALSCEERAALHSTLAKLMCSANAPRDATGKPTGRTRKLIEPIEA